LIEERKIVAQELQFGRRELVTKREARLQGLYDKEF
jgi:hypothetical protein